MALGIESGSVSNRSFSPGGLGDAMFTWFTKIPANHGPGWYLWDDRRSDSINPYVVFSDQSSPTPNSKAMFIQVQMSSSTERMNIISWLWWDNVSHTGLVRWFYAQLTTVTGTFAYYLRGGTNLFHFATRIGTSVTHCRMSKFQGIWNAVTGKGLEPETASGVLSQPAFIEANDNNNQVSEYYNLTGYEQHLDANGKLYFSVVISGANMTVNIYKDSARTQLIGHTGPTGGTGVRSVTADNSSGLSGNLRHSANVANDTDIECQFLRLHLQAGQGANFTANRWYFLISLLNGVRLIAYVKVTAIVGDILIIQSIGGTGRDFPAGSYISPFPHRWIGATSQAPTGGNSATIPYRNSNGNEGGDQFAYSDTPNIFASDWMGTSLASVNPDDDNEYPVQFPWVISDNRVLGKEIEHLIGAPGGLSPFSDRRIINSVPYICVEIFNNNGRNYASLVLDQEST